jgi:hypothetical protein
MAGVGAFDPSAKASRFELLACLGLCGLLGAWVTRDAVAQAAVTWMYIYEPSDFPATRSLWAYLSQFRVPMPPVIVGLEIWNHQSAGHTSWVTVGLYRAGIVGSYAIALALSGPSRARLYLSLCVSCIFLFGTSIVHRANPQVYDLLFPLFVLAFFWCVRRADDGGMPGWSRAAAAAAAGFSLSMAELSRPFVVFLLPLLLAHAWLRLRRRPIALRVVLLAPVVLLSGAYHVHLARRGQVTWTNHSGFNLHNAWPMAPWPDLVEEVNAGPLRPGRWANLDTPEHAENSRRFQRAVASYVRDHPLESVWHAGGRIVAFLQARTTVYRQEPRHVLLGLYRATVWAAVAGFAVALLRLAASVVRRPPRVLDALSSTDGAVIGTAAACILILAVGESHEEGRLLLSVLPLLAVLPQPLPRSTA